MTRLQNMNSKTWCLHILLLTICFLAFSSGISGKLSAEKGDRLVPANPVGGNSKWKTDVNKNKKTPPPAATPAPIQTPSPASSPTEPAPAPAETATAPDPETPEDIKTASIQKINDFFNNNTNIEGTFLQTDSSNNQTKGKFYIKQPGRIRFDYDSPSNMRIVSDGKWLSIEDPDLSTYDRYPLSNTPFRMLLKSNVDLAADAEIVDFFKGDDLIILTLADKNENDSGKIKLFFSTTDIKLKEWIITDPQGLDTRVQVADLVFGKKISPGFFIVSEDTLSVFKNK